MKLVCKTDIFTARNGLIIKKLTDLYYSLVQRPLIIRMFKSHH